MKRLDKRPEFYLLVKIEIYLENVSVSKIGGQMFKPLETVNDNCNGPAAAQETGAQRPR